MAAAPARLCPSSQETVLNSSLFRNMKLAKSRDQVYSLGTICQTPVRLNQDPHAPGARYIEQALDLTQTLEMTLMRRLTGRSDDYRGETAKSIVFSESSEFTGELKSRLSKKLEARHYRLKAWPTDDADGLL